MPVKTPNELYHLINNELRRQGYQGITECQFIIAFSVIQHQLLSNEPEMFTTHAIRAQEALTRLKRMQELIRMGQLANE